MALYGTDVTQEGTIKVVLTATASVSGMNIQLPFTVIARDCTPKTFVAKPATMDISLLALP